jgi:glycosyltransferase involved in cell wall biosynthesis
MCRANRKHRQSRILYCEGNTDGTVGGSYFSLLYLVSGLNRSCYTPEVIFYESNGLISEFLNAGINVRVISKARAMSISSVTDSSFVGYRFAYPFLRILQKASNFFRLFLLSGIKKAWYLRRHKIDLLHLNNSITRNHDWMLAAQLSGTTFVTHERGINEVYSKTARHFAKRIHAIICISNAVRENLRDKGLTSPNVVTIYNGINPSIMRPKETPQQIRSKYNIDVMVNLIGVIGNIRRWKGQETAVKALPAILAKFPATVCLFVGDLSSSDEDYGRHLQKLVAELNLQGNVVFAGFAEDIASHINALDVVLHTSTEPEPFGRVLIEAMSLGKPLIGAAAGAVPEIIEHGVTGLTFAPGDEVALASCVVDMLDEPGAARVMGQAGLARLLSDFHISQNIQRTEQLYATLLAGQAKKAKSD